MDLSKLGKIKEKGKRRLGRGLGSGRGKTAGRGTKGQKARRKLPVWYGGEPMGSSWIKRTAMLAGKGRNKPKEVKPVLVKVGQLKVFRTGSTVDEEKLKKEGLFGIQKSRRQRPGVKIVGGGQLKKRLRVKVAVSEGARKTIEKVGGQVLSKISG